MPVLSGSCDAVIDRNHCCRMLVYRSLSAVRVRCSHCKISAGERKIISSCSFSVEGRTTTEEQSITCCCRISAAGGHRKISVRERKISGCIAAGGQTVFGISHTAKPQWRQRGRRRRSQQRISFVFYY